MKSLQEYLLNESIDNNFNFNISLFDNGKLEWTKLYKNIVNSIEKSKDDTILNIDAGKLGNVIVEFTNKSSNTCNFRIAMKDLSKYVKFDKEVNDEYIEEKSTMKDLLMKMKNIINKIKEAL